LIKLDGDNLCKALGPEVLSLFESAIFVL